MGYVKSPGLMGKLIRIGEGLTGKSEVNHMVVFGNDGKVIQAEMAGVTYNATYEDILSHGICYVVKPPREVNLKKVVQFAEAQVGISYGLWTDIGIGIDMVTWQWVPAFRGARKPSWICSALGTESLRFGGWLHNTIDIYTITPQQSKDALLSAGGVLV